MTTIAVRVTANARHTQQSAHWDGQRLHVRLAAAPREGAANSALIELLAVLFSVPKTTIRLLRGAHAREKQVTIPLPQEATFAVLQKTR